MAAGSWGELPGERGVSANGCKLSSGGDIKGLEWDSGDGRTALWLYEKLVGRTL